ncbi:unnamed protein product [Parascedosporium putredinis]|uniref:F-box domain-containing protein n=1 Tax=Parascedosporium putredinis TaxID=1442378 RepID=A0A9P1GYQ1_9PEZI|nr:unnamed protein product [Parascedosporium putredinis]CAI7990152.1 unnamed protein product [Parascedosporium putredinis]
MNAERRYHCIVCGIQIIRNQELDHWTRSAESVIVVNAQWQNARYTGAWDRDNPDQAVYVDGAPVPADIPLRILLLRPTIGGPAVRHLREPLGVACGFPVHTACWEILQSTRPEEPLPVQSIFELCASVPNRIGAVNFGHTYGGIFGYRMSLPVQNLPIAEETSLFYVTAEDTFPVRQDEGSSLGPGSPSSSDPFAGLPTEITQLIFELLSSKDVANLKLASRTCAALTLPDTFWKSRFLSGHPRHVHQAAARTIPFSTGAEAASSESRPLTPEPYRVFISTVDVFGKRYASGMRFESTSGTSTGLGYVHASTEVLVAEARIQIAGLLLAHDERGIRGISVIPSTGPISKWVGEHQSLPHRRLMLQSINPQPFSYLSGAFNAFGFVAMSTGDGRSSPSDLRIHDLAFWFPGVPDPRNEFLGIEHSPSDVDNSLCTQRPVYHSIFAEPDLIDLSDLGRIAGIHTVHRKNELNEWLVGIVVYTSSGRLSVYPGRLGEAPVDCEQFHRDVDPGIRVVAGFCTRMETPSGITEFGLVVN